MKRSHYVKQDAHLLEPWRNVMLFGRAEWDRQHPKRYILLIREAITRLRLRHWELVTVWNPFHHPIYRGRPCDAGFQLIDFVLDIRHRPFVVLVRNPNSLIRPHEKARWQAKIDLLNDRKIPYVVVPVHYTSQEYQVRIGRAITKGTT